MGTFEGKLAGLSALLLLATPVHASIPPPIGVRVISSDRDSEAMVRGLVEIISAYDNFQRADSAIGPAVRDCLRKADAETCARAEIRKGPSRPDAPPVLVIVHPGKGDVYRLTCVGVGEKPSKAEAQHISIDMKQALFAAPRTRFPLQHKALTCIWSAAAEANGIIKAN